MNGLLHRLAARATGTAVPVRSDAGLPYGGGAPAWADTPESEFAETRDALRPGEQASLPRGDQPGGVEPGLLPPSTAVQTAAVAPSDKTPSGMAPRVAHDLMDESKPAIAPLPEQPLPRRTEVPSVRDQEPVAPLPEPPLLARAEVPLVRDAGALPAMLGEPLTEHRHRPGVAPFESSADVAARVAPPQGNPTPLMPPAADQSRHGPILAASMRSTLGATRQLGAWPQAAAKPAEEATEVHIHIGRIDVTAVHEAPPPRRKPAATPAPMSLDTYLTRRSRS
jgi:hypothetical protein